MADEITTVIQANAVAGIRRAQGDEGSVEQHPLPDLIQADEHVRRVSATQQAHRGIRFTQLCSPGAVR